MRSMMGLENDDSQLTRSEHDARAALDIDSGLPVAWEAMFHVHVHQGKFQEALEDASRMKLAGAPAQEVALYRGTALGRLGRDAEAETELTSSLAVEPGNFLALEAREKERLRRNDAEGAAQDLLELVKIWPSNADYWESLKNAEDAGDHAALARDALDHQIALQPGQAGLWEERAKLDAAMGDHKTALDDYDKAISIDSSDSATWIERAPELWRLSRDSEAVSSCLKGLELKDSALNRSACAVVEWETGDHARAIKTVDSLLPHREEMEAADKAFWFADVGEALMSYGRAKEAVPFLRRALQSRPHWSYGPLFLYFARAMSGDEAAARTDLAARPMEHPDQWPGHLADYLSRRLDDEALRNLTSVDAPGDVAGQACEANFYIGLRHWLDGDVAAGKALLALAASECPRTFTETKIAKAWLALGPGMAR